MKTATAHTRTAGRARITLAAALLLATLLSVPFALLALVEVVAF